MKAVTRRWLDDAAMGLRYARGLPEFLRAPVTARASDEHIRASRASRVPAFLAMIERSVFGHASSPYLPLMRAAGVELGDVIAMTGQLGVEGTLERLYVAGVRMSLDEFKGLARLERAGVSRPLKASDFDNPHVTAHFTLLSGGSRGIRRRLVLDLDHLADEAATEYRYAAGAGILERASLMWRSAPPGVSGLKTALRRVKMGRPVAAWFSPTPVSLSAANLRHSLLTIFSTGVGYLKGRAVPWPRYVPLDRAETLARWLAARRSAGGDAVLETNASGSVRVCRAALDRGLDIAGTVCRIAGEPFTRGKADVLARAGCHAAVHYAMAETGRIGLPCGRPEHLDEVHFLDDRLAVLQQPVDVRGTDWTVPALVLTAFHPSAPKILLNVDSGDHAVVSTRRCGCALDTIGFATHLHDIRSHEKLTSEGMTFPGQYLLVLIDEVLPQRFGGGPTDYQFVEREEQGTTKVDLVIAPAVGPVDEDEVRAMVLERLGQGGPTQAMMAARWRDAGTLTVRRRDPLQTASAKVQPLHASVRSR
jgi:hypothetical protein